MQNHLILKSINFDTISPTDLKNLSGLLICLLQNNFFLFVGETCGLPRANTVRPYRVLVKGFAISPLTLHALTAVFFIGFLFLVLFFRPARLAARSHLREARR